MPGFVSIPKLSFGRMANLVTGTRAGMAGDQSLAFAFMGQLVGGGQASMNYHFSDGNTVVHVDADGDGNADIAITLNGQTNFLALSDLVL